FRYSLDQVSDLDLDPDLLAARRFRFVKVEAGRLLAPPPGMEPAELKNRLDSRGIDLIVEKIETEPMLVELLDLNIDFGQGYLFGEPRLSRPDAGRPGAFLFRPAVAQGGARPDDLLPPVPVLSGLREIADDYDGCIVDLWGVMHDGVRPYPGACET